MSTKIIKQRRLNIPKISYIDRKIVALKILRYAPDLKDPHLIVGCSEKTFRRYRKELEETKYQIMPRKPYEKRLIKGNWPKSSFVINSRADQSQR